MCALAVVRSTCKRPGRLGGPSGFFSQVHIMRSHFILRFSRSLPATLRYRLRAYNVGSTLRSGRKKTFSLFQRFLRFAGIHPHPPGVSSLLRLRYSLTSRIFYYRAASHGFSILFTRVIKRANALNLFKRCSSRHIWFLKSWVAFYFKTK